MNNQTQAPATDALTRRSLNLIFLVMLMDIIGLTIIGPVAPYIVKRYSGEAFMVTALSGIYAAAQFLAAPALGKISDRVGRRPVLLISIFGSAIGYFIFGIGGALWVLFLSRVIDGITGGNLSTASAYIADVSTPQTRAKNFGLIGVAFGLGFILGPALGGLASQVSIDAPAFLAGILSMINLGLVYFLLPESLPAEKRERTPMVANDFNPLVAIGEMARKSGLTVLLVINSIFALAFNGANSSTSVFFVYKFTAAPWQIGAFFVVGGAVTFVTQMWFVQRVVGRFGEKTMAIASLVGMSAGSLLTFMLPQFWMLYPLALLQSGIGSFVWSTMGSMMASKVEPREQGLLAGVNTALMSLMGVFGPFAAGVAYDQIMPGAPLWLAAILLGIAAAAMLVVRAHVQTRPVSWS
jgi:MFS transporter, DHA1 family, tetracycline resistance protein